MPAASFVGSARALFTGSTTCPVSYSNTPGNALVACGFWAGPAAVTGLTSVTDSLSSNPTGDTWVYATSNSQNPPSVFQDFAGTYYGAFVAWCLNAAQVDTVTGTIGGGGSNNIGMVVSEWNSLGIADVGSASTGTTSTNIPTTAINLSTTFDTVIAFCVDVNGGISTAPAGSTELVSSYPYGVYEQPGASGSFTFTWANSTSSDGYVNAVMAFQPTPPPPGGPPVLYSMRMMP